MYIYIYILVEYGLIILINVMLRCSSGGISINYSYLFGIWWRVIYKIDSFLNFGVPYKGIYVILNVCILSDEKISVVVLLVVTYDKLFGLKTQ